MTSQRKTLLLTGATGFLGSHILAKLLLHQEYYIICLKRSFSNTKRLKDLNSSNLKFYDIDNTPLDLVFRENKIDVIIHVATEYGREKNSIYRVLSSNLLFPIELIETAINYNVKCFINTDSFFNKKSFSYTHLLDYSLSKKSLLTWLKYLSNKIQIANVVLEHVYGEDDNPEKFVEKVILNVAVKQVEGIDLTYGHQRRDFIYVEDVISAYLRIIDHCLTEHFSYITYEIGRGESIEVGDFVKIVKDLSNSSTELNFGRIPYLSDEIMDSKADLSEITKLGWSPQISISDGISRIIGYYKTK